MVTRLEELKEDVEDAKDKVAGVFSFAEDLEDELKEIDVSNTKDALKKLHHAKGLFRWVGRGTRVVFRVEEKVIKDLKEIEKLLPDNLSHEDKGIEQKLEIAKNKLAGFASRFTGSIKNHLEELETNEALLKKFKDEPEKVEEIVMKTKPLLEQTEREIEELNKWLSTTEVVLKSVEDFMAKL